MIGVEDDAESARTLVQYALHAPVEDVVQLARRVVPQMESALDEAVQVWRDQNGTRSELLRAACLMANDPGRIDLLREPEQLTVLFQLLLAENPVWSKNWGTGFAPPPNASWRLGDWMNRSARPVIRIKSFSPGRDSEWSFCAPRESS